MQMAAAQAIRTGNIVQIKGRDGKHYTVIDLDENDRVMLRDEAEGTTAWGPLSKVALVTEPVITHIEVETHHDYVYDKVTREFTKPSSGFLVRAMWGNVDRPEGFGMWVRHKWEAEMIVAALWDGGIFDHHSVKTDLDGNTYVWEQWITTGRYICAELKRRGYKGKTGAYVFKKTTPPWEQNEDDDEEISLDDL